jgi:16S rRNA (uracil1498-N3)-methyltransferase
MTLPFFYIDEYDISQKEIALDEDTSRHIVQVLRMKKGEPLNLTDGKGNLLTTRITDDHKKHCTVEVTNLHFTPHPSRKTTIAVSLVKNSSRFEWFLEKATELGISEIIPLICTRTEKQKFRGDRMKNILISAMLQSQQVWLPVLHEPIAYELLFRQEEIVSFSRKLIAHCMESEKKKISELQDSGIDSQIILIGPEGDFTPEEIGIALQKHFIPVTLGNTRLRTETAGITAAVLLQVT